MKKILLLTPMLHQGGFERVCVETARLLETEYDVTMAVFNLEDLAFDVEGLKVVDLNLPVKNSKLGKILNVFRRARALSKLYAKEGIEVVYSFGITANRIAAVSDNGYTNANGEKIHVKKIMACHSFEEVKDERYMKLLDKRGDTLICCSKKMTQMSEKLHGLKDVTTLWNPFDVEKIQRQAEEISVSFNVSDSTYADASSNGTAINATSINEPSIKGPRLVTMGREDDVKGYWHLLKAFIRVHEKYPEATFTLIGDGDFLDLKQMATQAGVSESVTFTGHKMNPFPYVKNSDIYVLSSISEGLPMALVEAMSLGIPVVSTNCLSGPAEILSKDFETAESQSGVYQADFGILTSPFTWEKDIRILQKDDKSINLTPEEEDLANGILTLWENKELYEKYAKIGPTRAQDFSKQKYFEQLRILL